MSEGESNESTITIGYDTISGLNGNVKKKSNNNYYLCLTWNNVINPSPENITIKYIISYFDKVYETTNNYFDVPINYGTQEIDKRTGRVTTILQCVYIETRFVYDGGYYSNNENKFCFCPPVDPKCRKRGTTKNMADKKQVGSTKMRYASAIKNKNGATGFNGFSGNNCRTVNQWNSLNLFSNSKECYTKK